jgi:ATP-dependent Clp protease ATP-binding subunit ClpA
MTLRFGAPAQARRAGLSRRSRRTRKRILNPLSMRLLEGEFKSGDKIKVTAKDDVLVFAKK